MNMAPDLYLLGRYRRLIATITAIAGVLAFAGSYLLSPRYTATTAVLVHANQTHVLSSTGQDLSTQPGAVASSLTTTLTATYSGILTSRVIAEQVVSQLQLDQQRRETSFVGEIRSGIRQSLSVVKSIVIHGYYKQPGAYEAAVQNVQSSLQAKPVKDSYLIAVSASADDPKLARSLVETAANDLITLNRSRTQTEADIYSNFLKTRLTNANNEVSAAGQAIRDYKIAHHVTDVGTEAILSTQAEQNLRQQLNDANIALAAARAQYNAINTSLNTTSQTNATSSTVATGRSTTTITNVSPNSVYDSLLTQSVELRAQIEELLARRDAIQSLLQSMTVGSLPTRAAGLQELELRLSTAQSTYSALSTAYQAALLNSQANPTELTEVDKAAVPQYPDRPLHFLYLLIGLLFGFGGGIVLALRRARRDLTSRQKPTLETVVRPGVLREVR